MKAITIWQPWATLIMELAKPFEFRTWSYDDRYPRLVGQRVVIHAGKRPVQKEEVRALVYRLRTDDAGTGLKKEIALPILEKVLLSPTMLPLAAGLGTVILGKPRRATDIFKGTEVADSNRVSHHVFGWPVSDIERFEHPIPMKGSQGFWDWPEKRAA